MNFIDDVGNEVKEQSCVDDYDFGVRWKIILKLRKNKWKSANDNLKNIENSKNAKGQLIEKQLIRMFENYRKFE